MTCGTIRWELCRGMVRVRSSVVVGHMACATSCRRASVSIRMALDAGRGLVRTVQRESRFVVIKGGITP